MEFLAEGKTDLRRGAERAKELGYLLEPFWLRAPGMAGRRAATVLQARGIESVIVAPLPDGAHTLDFGWESFAVTAVGHSLEKPELHHVESAHAQRHLARRGSSRQRASGRSRTTLQAQSGDSSVS